MPQGPLLGLPNKVQGGLQQGRTRGAQGDLARDPLTLRNTLGTHHPYRGLEHQSEPNSDDPAN
ncbi:MAG: hypothetical protein ABGZ49_15225, partial [Akkermansiaceae bacterium]